VEKAKELKFTRDIFFTGGEVKMMVERGENLVPEVVEFASSHDIHINSIEVEHPNLEDVFIKYTGSKIVGEGR
jgi:ABC-2 type transport system ATP-binding protein